MIESAFADQYVLSRPRQTGFWDEKASRGIGFVGMGNEPFWNVEIDFSKQIRFSRLGDDAPLAMGIGEPEFSDNGQTVTFKNKSDEGELVVIIVEEACADTMSDEIFPFRVSVSWKARSERRATVFSGCGKYLGLYQLNGVWELESMNDLLIDSIQFPNRKPMLQFQMHDHSLSGFGGCNRLAGSFEAGADRLTFLPIASTKMACPQGDFEQRFLAALSERTFIYRILGDQLALLTDEFTLVFSRKSDWRP